MIEVHRNQEKGRKEIGVRDSASYPQIMLCSTPNVVHSPQYLPLSSLYRDQDGIEGLLYLLNNNCLDCVLLMCALDLMCA